MSTEDFQDMTLDQFVDGSLVSMFEGDDKKLKSLKKVRFSKQNISDIMKELVKRKYSQQAIKEALEEDYSPQDILNSYNEVRSEYQKEEYKNEGLFDPNKNILAKSLDIIYKSLLSKKGFRSKTQQVESEMMDGFIQASLKKASVASNRLTETVRKTNLKGEELKELSKKVNAVLNGKEATLPENVRQEVVGMRNHIDVLQKQLLNAGYLQTLSQQQAVEKGLGNYITRSYRIFDSKDYANEVSQQVIQKAKNYLRSTDKIQKQAQKLSENSIMDYQQALDHTVENSIQNILSKSDSVKFIKSAREGAKDVNSLKRRKEIPEPIRALMGEYEDPIQNYNRTILRVSSLVATGRYLDNVRKAGLNVFLFEKNDSARPKEFNTEIAPSTTDSYSPLSGLLTSPEIAQSLRREPLLNGQIFNSPLFKGYLKYVAAVKWSKTIASPGTHGKNIFGNLFFMASNGYTNPQAYIKAFEEVRNQIRVKGEMELSESLEKYIKLGIIDKSIVKTELMEMFGKSEQINVESLLERQQTRYYNMHKKQWWKNVKLGLEKAYQLEDDFFKIVSFEMELKRYGKAIGKGQPFERLDKQVQDEITQLASENTKNIIPNYNRIGSIREIYRSIPVLGTFVSFQLESYRTAYNTINLALKESKTPGLKSIGAKRLASVIGFQALYHYALTGFVGDIFGAISDDDEDEAEKYASQVLAPWSKNSNIAIIKAGDGKFTYIDFSAANPHGQIDRAIKAMSTGETVAETTVEILKEALGDFLDYDIAFGAAISIFNNEKPTGGTIWKPDDSVGTIIGSIANVLYKTIEPGLFRSAMKIKGADNKVLETIGQGTGYKPQEVDYRKGIEFRSRKIMNDMRDATSLNSLNRQLEDNKITQSAYDEALIRRDEYKLKKAKELIDLYKGGLFFGLDNDDIMEAMVERGGVSKHIFYQVAEGDVYSVSAR